MCVQDFFSSFFLVSHYTKKNMTSFSVDCDKSYDAISVKCHICSLKHKISQVPLNVQLHNVFLFDCCSIIS